VAITFRFGENVSEINNIIKRKMEHVITQNHVTAFLDYSK